MDTPTALLDELTPPFAFLHAAGLSLENDGAVSGVRCPTCGGLLHVGAQSFVCPGRSCGFGAGGAIDFIKASHPGISYADAAGRLLDTVPGLPVILQMPRHVLVGVVADRALRRRRWLEFFRRLWNEMPSTAAALEGPAGGLDTSGTLLLPRESDADRALSALGVTGRPGKGVRLIPFWSAPHILSAVVVSWARGKPSVVPLEPSLFAWTLLPRLNPRATGPALLAGSPSSAAAVSTALITEAGRSVCQALLFTPGAPRGGWLPETAVYLFDDKFDGGMAHVDALDAAGVVVEVSSGALRSGLPWRDFCHNRALSLLDDPAGLGAFASSVRGETLDFPRVMCAAPPGRASALALLEKLASRRILLQEGSDRLLADADGYLHQGSGAPQRITNFVVDPDKLVFFRLPTGATDMFLRCTLSAGGRSAGGLLPVKEAENVASTETWARSLALADPDWPELPTVLDKKAAARVSAWLRARSGHLPREEGTASLGWTPLKDAFILPGTRITPGEASRTGELHPDLAPVSACFTGSALRAAAGASTGGSPSAARFAAVYTALVARARRLASLPSVPCSGEDATRRFVLGAFSAMGQTSPIDSHKLPGLWSGGLRGVKGLPLLTDGRPPPGGGPLPFFYFDARGDHFPGRDPETAAGLVGAALPRLVGLLAAGADVPAVRALRHTDVLAGEGAWLLRECLGEWAECRSQFPGSEEWLTTLERDSLWEACEHDLPGQSMTLPLAGARDRDRLLAELGVLCRRIHATDRVVVVDALSAQDMLTAYFGKVPQGIGLRVAPISTPAQGLLQAGGQATP